MGKGPHEVFLRHRASYPSRRGSPEGDDRWSLPNTFDFTFYYILFAYKRELPCREKFNKTTGHPFIKTVYATSEHFLTFIYKGS